MKEIGDTMKVTGAVTLDSTLVVTGAVAITGASTLTGALAGNGGMNGTVNLALKKRVATQFDKAASTVLATVTDLSAPVEAGKTYSFEAVLHLTASAAGGIKVAIAGTATATSIIYHIIAYNSINSIEISARKTALAGSSGVTNDTIYLVVIKGSIVVNAAGTLLVQFAQNAASGTSSVLVGSTFDVDPFS